MNGPIQVRLFHAQNEAGYVADLTHAGYQQENWSPGQPKPAFWVGLKVKTDQFVPVTTLRCPHCGYLESYAIQPAVPDK